MDLLPLCKEPHHKDIAHHNKVILLNNSQVMDLPNNKEVIDLLNNKEVIMDLPYKEVMHHLNSNQGMDFPSNKVTHQCKLSTSMMGDHPYNNRGTEVYLTSSKLSYLQQVKHKPPVILAQMFQIKM